MSDKNIVLRAEDLNGEEKITVEKDAKMNLVVVINSPSKSVNSNIIIDQNEDSLLDLTTIIFDSVNVENLLKINLFGKNAKNSVKALYISSKKVINRTIINHFTSNCQSNQLYKGIIDADCFASFEGKIYVDKCAEKTIARQTNRHLLLDKKSQSHSEPHLEINNDDVKCSHGATCGSLNSDQLFYLLSRGIDEKEARKLLILAFAQEIIDNIPIDEIKNELSNITY